LAIATYDVSGIRSVSRELVRRWSVSLRLRTYTVVIPTTRVSWLISVSS